MKTIKVGIIGLGPNGQEHLANYSNHPDARVVAICDKNGELAEKTAAEHDIAGVYTGLDILEHPDLDMIAVCAPNPFHGEYAVRALEAGKHVFVEKPMALELENLEKIVRLWRRTGLKVMAGQILRFNALFKLTKDLIDDGVLGEILYVEGDYIHDLRGYPHKENPFASDGVHPLDLLRWYAGDTVEVQAYSNTMVCPELHDPTTVAIYRFRSGCVGKVTVLWTSIGPMPKAYNVSVYGSKASIVRDGICLPGAGEFAPISNALDRISLLTGKKYSLAVDWTQHPYKPEDDHFIDCLVNGKEPLVNALDGARSAAAVLAAGRAIQTGKPAPTPLFEEET